MTAFLEKRKPLIYPLNTLYLQDCRSNETCPPTPEIPPPKEPFLVFGYDGPLVILLIIYLALFIVCLVHLAINIHYRYPPIAPHLAINIHYRYPIHY